MEGPKCKVILSWWRSNLEQIKLFLCGNQFLRHGMQLGIKLSQDLLTGASYWGGGKSCGSKRTIIEKPNYDMVFIEL